MWNRLRYTVWAPLDDALVGAVGFANARRHSIERLGLKDGDRVLIVGAGTGLDLDFVAPSVAITAIDVTFAMLRRLTRRAAHAGRLAHVTALRAEQLGRLLWKGKVFFRSQGLVRNRIDDRLWLRPITAASPDAVDANLVQASCGEAKGSQVREAHR